MAPGVVINRAEELRETPTALVEEAIHETELFTGKPLVPLKDTAVTVAPPASAPGATNGAADDASDDSDQASDEDALPEDPKETPASPCMRISGSPARCGEQQVK